MKIRQFQFLTLMIILICIRYGVKNLFIIIKVALESIMIIATTNNQNFALKKGM